MEHPTASVDGAPLEDWTFRLIQLPDDHLTAVATNRSEVKIPQMNEIELEDIVSVVQLTVIRS